MFRRLVVATLLTVGLLAAPAQAATPVITYVTVTNAITGGVLPVDLQADCRLHEIHSWAAYNSGRVPQWVAVWDNPRSGNPVWVTISEWRLSAATHPEPGFPYVYTGWSWGTSERFISGGILNTSPLRILPSGWFDMQARTDGFAYVREHLRAGAALLPTFTWRCHLTPTQGT